MNLSEKQKSAIATLLTYPNDIVMHDGWMTGGHGVKLNLNTVRSLEKLGIIKGGKLTDKVKQ